MSIGPLVMVTRFVRDAVARASAAPFVISLRALGVEPKTVNRRLLRHGAVPVATLTGGLLPLLVGGSIIVENLFSLDGLGHLAFRAVLGQDQAIVMALVLLTSTVTLLALLISDLMHRLVDNRVRLMD
jgi:peptide/nickel transport system permease protein